MNVIDLAIDLKPFKADATSNDAAAALVLGDDEAVRVLAAFRNVAHVYKAPRKKRPEPDASLIVQWKWLTSNWTIDIIGISEAAGLSEEVVESKVGMLVANRLIYPDGTVAHGAVIALQMHTQVKLGIKPRPKQQQQAAKPEPKKDGTDGTRP
jgi:hypothetical protein